MHLTTRLQKRKKKFFRLQICTMQAPWKSVWEAPGLGVRVLEYLPLPVFQSLPGPRRASQGLPRPPKASQGFFRGPLTASQALPGPLRPYASQHLPTSHPFRTFHGFPALSSPQNLPRALQGVSASSASHGLPAPNLLRLSGRRWEALGGPGRPWEALGGPGRPACGGPVFCVLCFVFWVLGFVFWVLGFGFCVLGFVFWVLCLGVLGFVFWFLGFVFWVLCFVFWILRFGFWFLGFVFWVLGFVFCVLCFVFCVLGSGHRG